MTISRCLRHGVNKKVFRHKVVAITGAGSGIGRALAREFAAHGARLALSDISEGSLVETARQLSDQVDVRTYVVDVSSRDAVFAFAADVKRDFGAAHVVVNNAGLSVLGRVDVTTLEEIEKVLNVNLWGTIFGTKAFLPVMLGQGEGCIVNISSVFGLLAVPCQGAYTMSKFAVRALTETLWQELDGTGVRAVVVHPGGINTNISKNSAHALHEGDLERTLERAMLGQMTTTPEVCAKQIVAGLLRGDRRLLVGNGARTLHWLSRLFPEGYGSLVRRKLGV